ncbi:MAG: BamA/TamA family outer membrane protein [Daejeonella sp.]
MLKGTLFFIFITLSLLFAAGCGPAKYLPKGEKLYTGADVKVQGDSIKKKEVKALRAELKSVLRPKPNTSFLGFRYKLWIYNIAGTVKKPKGFRNWLKNKIGEPPVLESTVNLEKNQTILKNRLENKGYFQSVVTSNMVSKKHQAKAKYVANTGPQYKINTVSFPSDSGALERAITATADKTLLKPGDAYNFDVIRGERNRIDQILKEQGFYYFGPDYLLVQVDSTVGKHLVNLYVTVKPATPNIARKVYTINNIYIYPNYSLKQTRADTSKTNAVFFDKFYIIDQDSTFKPTIFSRSIFFKPGDVYNRADHNLSLNRLITLGPFKFVKNRFETVTDSTKPQLDAFYYLTPLPRKSLRAEILGTTKSNNLTGSELSVSWKNRNAFRAAEQLSIRAYGSFEVQLSGNQSGYNTYRIGSEATLSIPRFVIPFFKWNTTGAFVPRTKFSLGYELVNKSKLYSLNSFKALAGYNWKENSRKEHELNLLSINYVQPANLTDLFKASLPANPDLQKIIDKQFIIGTTYSFTYNNQTQNTRRNSMYFNGNADLSGNILGLATGANYKEGKVYSLFGAPFSQYIRLDGDYRYYLKLGSNSELANRATVGFGYPYGNSSELPFTKQFFVGGSNSIRAFRSRSVGPGTYYDAQKKPTDFLADRAGDIKVEFNSEYRTKLVGRVNGALFADAGNVWLYNEDPNKPDSKFTKNFMNELAVGTGLGLRFDLSFLILRTDLAFPIRKPWLPKGQRWVFNQVDFTDSQWRRENLIFNLAIGYPF